MRLYRRFHQRFCKIKVKNYEPAKLHFRLVSKFVYSHLQKAEYKISLLLQSALFLTGILLSLTSISYKEVFRDMDRGLERLNNKGGNGGEQV